MGALILVKELNISKTRLNKTYEILKNLMGDNMVTTLIRGTKNVTSFNLEIEKRMEICHGFKYIFRKTTILVAIGILVVLMNIGAACLVYQKMFQKLGENNDLPQ